VPNWPDFSLDKVPWRGSTLWIARTYTGRPKTPVFSISVNANPELDEESVREIAQLTLEHQYRKAHPHGCPGVH
jgi:hypothetical protein